MLKSNIIEALKKLILVTKYSEDMAFDLRLIYSDRIHHYGKNADEYELYRIKEHHELLKDLTVTPSDNIRIYVITGMECVMAVCTDISESTKDRLVGWLRTELSLSDRFPSDSVDPNFISTIYVFEKDKPTYSADFYPYMMGTIVHMLRKKNRIKHGDSDQWFKD